MKEDFKKWLEWAIEAIANNNYTMPWPLFRNRLIRALIIFNQQANDWPIDPQGFKEHLENLLKEVGQ